MYLHLLTKLSQSCHVVYRVQPVVMMYTHPQSVVHTVLLGLRYSAKFGDLSIIFIVLALHLQGQSNIRVAGWPDIGPKWDESGTSSDQI